jgi:hypothetical protein
MAKKEQQVKATTLAGKLVEIRKGLGRVEKTKRNPHFGYNYVSLEHLNALLEPKFSEKNIHFSTAVVSADVHYGDTKAGVFASVVTDQTFIDGETGEMIVGRSAGLGWDAGDKATAKAITAAVKSYLKANFMISDEADDPEGSAEPPTAEPKGAAGHRRTKEYEAETGEGDKKVATDLLELKAFLTEHKIPDGFLLRLLQEKKMIDGHTKNVAQIKPGILRRCLDQKSKDNLVKAWEAQKADEESGSENPPHPFNGEPRKTAKAEPEDEDQRRKQRKPVVTDIAPSDVLEQEGIDNWREVKIHFGKQEGTALGKLPARSLQWWIDSYVPKPYKGTWQEKDLLLDAGLCLASEELSGE